MKRIILRLVILNVAVLGLLSACAPDDHDAPKIAESQRAALDKAKAMQSNLNQEAEEQKKKIDQQSE